MSLMARLGGRSNRKIPFSLFDGSDPVELSKPTPIDFDPDILSSGVTAISPRIGFIQDGDVARLYGVVAAGAGSDASIGNEQLIPFTATFLSGGTDGIAFKPLNGQDAAVVIYPNGLWIEDGTLADLGIALDAMSFVGTLTPPS